MIKLNIACGTNVFPGWINIDRTDVEDQYLRHLRTVTAEQAATWPEEQQRLVRYLADGRIQFFQWDLRRGFPMYPDGSVEAIYCGQMIEHLQPTHEVPAFLRECHRMLAQGGCVRITTPDLDKLVGEYSDLDHPELDKYALEQPSYYKGALREDKLSYIMFGAGGTNERYEGHQHLYTKRSLADRLQQSGFKAYVNPDVWRDCIDKGMSHSFAIDAVKR